MIEQDIAVETPHQEALGPQNCAAQQIVAEGAFDSIALSIQL